MFVALNTTCLYRHESIIQYYRYIYLTSCHNTIWNTHNNNKSFYWIKLLLNATNSSPTALKALETLGFPSSNICACSAKHTPS